MRRIKLDKFADVPYFLANLSLINSYIEDRINEGRKFFDIEIYYFDNVNKMLEKNKQNINWTKIVNNIKINIEFILLKENSSEEYYKLIENLFYSETCISEEDMLLALTSPKDKEYNLIFRNIIEKNINLFSYSTKTINAIKDFIDDDKWFDSLGEKRVKKITKNIKARKNIKMTSDLLNKFRELLNILTLISLNPNSVKDIIVVLKKYSDKLNDEEIVDILDTIEDIIKADPIYNTTSKIINDEINLETGNLYIDPLCYDDDNLAFFEKKVPIITLDGIVSPDLDSAFSIRKENDLYFFNVYVTDTPSFLGKNKDLSINAYKQGTSFYLRHNKKNINLDMLPEVLSHDYLSMLQNSIGQRPKNAICFKFIFKDDGTLEECKVSRNKVIVDYNLFKEDGLNILCKNAPLTPVEESVFLLQELTKLVSKASNKPSFQYLKDGKIGSMIAFPSILINCYLAENLEYGIYYEDGLYKKEVHNDLYIRAGAPLRRYADDINLAIFLEQENLQHFNKDDFRYLENNFDEIIAHLNEQNFLGKYIDKNNDLVKRYYMKKRD